METAPFFVRYVTLARVDRRVELTERLGNGLDGLVVLRALGKSAFAWATSPASTASANCLVRSTNFLVSDATYARYVSTACVPAAPPGIVVAPASPETLTVPLLPPGHADS